MATSPWIYIGALFGALVLILLVVVLAGPAAAPSASGLPSSGSILPPAIGGSVAPPGSNPTLAQKSALFPQAPPWSSYQGVINGPQGSDSLSMADLKGHVVLLDFWTYSCINCIRTLPYVTAWDAQYRSQGLVIVGFHSPEFEFEKDRANIQAAVTKYNIQYPVVLDGDHQIWNIFGNSYWPRHYLIDCDGYIREDHIGEGGYADTEAAIRALLAECNTGKPAANLSKMPMANVTGGETVDFNQPLTPEMYFGGNERRQPLGNDNGQPTRPNVWRNFTLPATPTPNTINLGGTWLDADDHMQLLDAQGDIELTYTARSVYLVASAAPSNYAIPSNAPLSPISTPGTATLTTTIDGKPAVAPDADSNGRLTVTGSRLYRVAQTTDYGTHTLVLHVTGSNFSAFSFTFG